MPPAKRRPHCWHEPMTTMSDDLLEHIRANTATDAPPRPEGDEGKIRVLLADDHTILRAGLRMMLNAQRDIEVVGEASDGRQAIAEAQRLLPDVIIMDISMPECNGFEATRQVKRTLPDVPVLVLSIQATEQDLFQVIRAGTSAIRSMEA